MKPLIRIIILVVLVSAVILGVRWFLKVEGNQSASELRIYGNIDIRKADLAFNEQGRIAQVLVEEGDRVTAGQVLARLQTNRLEAKIREMQAKNAAQQEVVKRLEAGTRRQEIEQARAEVTAARARVKNAMKNYERIRKASEAGATSQQALDNARVLLDVDQAQVKVKEKALNLALEGPRRKTLPRPKTR